MKPSMKRRQFMVFLIDLVVLYAVLFLSLAIRNIEIPRASTWWGHAYYFSYIFFGWLLIFYILRLYALDVPFNSLKFAARLAIAVSVSGLSTALFFYLAPDVPITPKTVLFLFVILSYLAILGWRQLYAQIMRLSPIRSMIGFIGFTTETTELIHSLLARPHLGFNLAFVYDESDTTKYPDSMPIVRSPNELGMFLSSHPVPIIVLADHLALSVEARRILFSLIEQGTRFERLQYFYEVFMRRVPLGVISEAWFLENIDLRSKKPYMALKRALDIVFAFGGLLLLAPFWPILVLAIKLGSPGPVLFSQVRLGRLSKPFTIYKLRTMRVEGNDQSPTSAKDKRITALGSFLRKTRLDELPQMVNILKGDMSFVGPRPERPELAEDLSKLIPFYQQRHIVKPGITGWDQVSGEYHSPSVEDTYKKLQYDLYYVRNLSPFLDASIFFKTIMTVLSRSGR